MDDELYEAWLAKLTLRGDQAYLPGETAPRPYRKHGGSRRAAYKREWQRRYRDRKRREMQQAQRYDAA